MNLLWLIPLLPFAGAALNGGLGMFGRRPPKGLVTLIGLGAPGISFLLALNCLWEFLGTAHAPVEKVLYAWTTGELRIDFAFLLDPLSAVMLFVVTFIGFLIHVYSVGYMGHEEGYRRYFTYLNLFMGSMLLLILGNNYLVMFMGWEGVGLCSYLLVGFYYDQEVPPAAGKKAFIVNRIGDFAFLVGMFALFAKFGTLQYQKLFPVIAADPSTALAPYGLGMSLAAFVALCFFVGAMGKSAQIPLYVWLPDAMAGPTPVSALIHAATMVTAGVYMVARTNVLYQLAPGVGGFVAAIGAATALFAASIGLAQNDIKKVLAYSTVSQLGYMFLAAGLGAYSVAVFHLMTHAFFKALLFLGSGSVIHAMGGEQDMRKMGGLKKALPITWATFVLGALAIAGFPGFSGFFSKDAILAAAAGNHNWALYFVGLLTALLTAFYMFRAVFLTFYGEFRGTEEQRHHLHESPPSMTVPLVLLAVGAVASGWVGITFIPGWDRFQRFLLPTIYRIAGHERVEPEMGRGGEFGLMGLAIVIALSGIYFAWRIYGGAKGAERGAAWEAGHAGLQRVLAHKYWVDEIYDRLIVRPLAWTSRVILWKIVDNGVIDGTVKAGAFAADLTGHAGRLTTTGNIRNYALYFFLGVLLLFWWMTLS